MKNGDILEIPLINQYGFGYAKFISGKKNWRNTNIPDVLRVYNFYNKIPISNLDVLFKNELLFAPVAISRTKEILNYNWKIIDNKIVTEVEKFLPFVKSGWPHFAEKPERWVYYEELGNTTKMYFEEYDNLKHLEYSRVIDVSIIPFKITLELMKLKNEDIKNVYQMNWLEEVEYKNSIGLPSYVYLPEKLKGRI